ncbi:hypothetical protein BCR33DRAFT_854423, partial [Rhizoclosmatium globosum]
MDSIRLPFVVHLLIGVPILVTLIIATLLPRLVATSNALPLVSVQPPQFDQKPQKGGVTSVVGTATTATTSTSTLPPTTTTTTTNTSTPLYYIARPDNSLVPAYNLSYPSWPVAMDDILPSDPTVVIVQLGYAFGFRDVCATYALKSTNKSVTWNGGVNIGGSWNGGANVGGSWNGGGWSGTGFNGGGVYNVNWNRTQTCISVAEYCSFNRLPGSACSTFMFTGVLQIISILFHVVSLAAMMLGVSMIQAAQSGSRFGLTRRRRQFGLQFQQESSLSPTKKLGGSMRWLFKFTKEEGRETETPEKYYNSINKTGKRMLGGSFILQLLGEIASILSLAFAILAIYKDPLNTNPAPQSLKPNQRFFVSPLDPIFSLSTSSQLLFFATALNILMTILTFSRYRVLLFPSKTTPMSQGSISDRNQIPSNQPEIDDFRRFSLDSDNPAATNYNTRDEELYNQRFQEWTRSVAQETVKASTFQHTAPTISSSKPVTPTPPKNTTSLYEVVHHDTRSNHSTGSDKPQILLSPAAPVPTIIHQDTRSNYSNGSLYQYSLTVPSVPIPDTSSSSTPANTSGLTHRKQTRSISGKSPIPTSTSIPQTAVTPISTTPAGVVQWKQATNYTPDTWIPLPVTTTSSATLSTGMLAVIPPPSGEEGGLEYIEMKPVTVVHGGGGRASVKSVTTMRGTVVFDD